MSRASAYNFNCNDVNGKFGTDATATGIPISEQHYTAAVPMNGSPYRPGDVVIVKNNTNGTSAVYLITDVGGLPHADIDLVEGVGTKALGMVASHSSNGGVKALSNSTDISIQKVGKLDFKNPAAVKEWQLKSHEINQGKASLADLAAISGFKPSVDASKLNKTLASYAPDMVPDALPSRGYSNMAEGETRRKQEDYLSYLNTQVAPEDKMFMMFVAVMVGIFTGQSAEQIFGMIAQMTGNSAGWQGAANGIGDGSQRKEFVQAPINAPTEWKNAWNAGNRSAETKALMATVPDAVAGVVADPSGRTVIYQELKGTGDHTYGVMVFKDKNGELQCLPTASGGAGNGSLPGASTGTGGAYDPRYPDAKGIQDYKITNFHGRNDSLGEFSFDLQNGGTDYIKGTGRGAIRIHVGGGTSFGCQHVSAKDGGYVANELAERANSGGLTYKILPSLDKDNVLVKEVARIKAAEEQTLPPRTPTPQALPETTPAPQVPPRNPTPLPPEAKPAENKSASTQPEAAEDKPDYAALVEEAKARVAAGKGEVPAQGLADLRTKSAEQSASIA